MQGVLFFMPSQRRIDPGDIGDRGAAELESRFDQTGSLE
jgi:hypothetical protein